MSDSNATQPLYDGTAPTAPEQPTPRTDAYLREQAEQGLHPKIERERLANMRAEQGYWVVTAYKWGCRDNHSYIVGIYSTESVAKDACEKEVEYRGGKYGCEAIQLPLLTEWREDITPLGWHYVESPYVGMAGHGQNYCDTNQLKLALTKRTKETK